MRKLAIISTILCCFFINSAYAKIDIHFSKVQFYLGDDKRSDSLRVSNQGNDDASCSITLAHFLVSEDGAISRVKEGLGGVYNPAEQLVRYSPRSVKIPANTSQAVRLSFRRIPNLDDGEYISYLRLKCDGKAPDAVVGKISTAANLYYNLPVVIRHGAVNANSKIVSAQLGVVNGVSYVEIEHQRLPEATGSVIGDYQVLGKESGKVYGVLASAKIYAPAKFRIQKFNLTEKPNEPLIVKFTMNQLLGDVVIEQNVTNL